MSAAVTVRRVEWIMGTAFSFAVRSSTDPAEALDETVAWLRWADQAFSPYRPSSWLCRLRRGEVREPDLPASVAAVLDRCRELTGATAGYFSVAPAGELDLCGYVKGWAVESASARLQARGWPCHAIGGGGDVRVRAPLDASPWRVGVAHPHRPGEVLAAVESRDLAIATSGTAERGAHIVDPMTGRAATEIASVTMLGPDLGIADAYATAAVAMGLAAARAWLAGLVGHEAMLVSSAGARWSTARFPAPVPARHGLCG